MTEQSKDDPRDQAAIRDNGAAGAAGLVAAGQPAGQRDVDAVPLSAGAVGNGGGYTGGGRSPDDAVDASGEPRDPLDSRDHFGGDGAAYVDPSIGDRARRATVDATGPGDDGYDPEASRGVDQDRD